MSLDEIDPLNVATSRRSELQGSTPTTVSTADPDSPVPDWLHVQIQQALEHLYDYVYLQELPLANLIGSAGEGWNRGAALHRFLVETIDRLKPPANTPSHSQLWRRYRYAFLRYIEAATVAQIVEELGVSERQARRDNNKAIEATAGLLRQKLGIGATREPRSAASSTPDTKAVEPTLTTDPDPNRTATSAPRSLTHLDEIVRSVLTTSQNLAETKGVAVAVQTPDSPILVSVERTVIRQIVLTIVVGVLEVAKRGDRVLASIDTDGTTARVIVEVPLASDGGLVTIPGMEDRVALAGRLTKPAGGSVAAEHKPSALRITLTFPAAPFTTVLLVEDNPGMRRLLKRYLSGSGYAVIEAQNADEAIALANEYQPDVITLDVMMPSKDGWEVLQTLRAQPRTRHIPVLVCSVLKEGDLARSLGAAAVISKPITQGMLLRALADLRRPSER